MMPFSGDSYTFDPNTVKKDFPILSRQVRDGKDLVYLDSAATSQKPYQVLDAERFFYENSNAAVHRGVHQLAEEATDAYEKARREIAGFIGASPNELVFTRNATEALNLVAYAFSNATALAALGQLPDERARRFVLAPGDEIVITEMEHHANLIPWQEVCAKTGAVLKWFDVTDEGRLDLSGIDGVITPRTKVVALTHVSNVLGTINPLEAITARAKAVGAFVLLDACQSVPHLPVDAPKLGVDAIAFGGHKMLGPTGIGCLWATRDALEAMPAFITGGSMIEKVSMTQSTFAEPPKKFEAGTPVAAQAVGLAAAANYLNQLDMSQVAAHDHALTEYALGSLSEIPAVRIIGPNTAIDRIGAISFTLDGVHPHDVGQVLDDEGIAVRTGHHCAWPLMRRFEVPATTRASFHVYNTPEDIDALVGGLRRVQSIFG